MKKSIMDEFVNKYWKYYLEIENQLLEIQKYVEFDKRNHNTYSVEFLKLFQLICGEIDCCAKVISLYGNSSVKVTNYMSIKNWGYEIQQMFPDISLQKVIFNQDYGISPWKNWKYIKGISKDGKKIIKLEGNSKTPYWWTKYQKVKHYRMKLNDHDVNYQNANLKNTIVALAGLFILERSFIEYLYFEKADPGHDIFIGKSKLFSGGRFRIIEKMK